MASQIFLNDIGTKILLDTGSDLTGATLLQIKFKKPDGTTGTWTATIDTDTEKLFYITLDGDLDQIGQWECQCYVEVPGWKGHGERARFNVVSPM